MSDWLVSGEFATTPLDLKTMLLSLLLAFLAGQTLAWVYMLTHSGLSYSRSFVNSLIIIPVIVSLVMLVLSNNLVTARAARLRLKQAHTFMAAAQADGSTVAMGAPGERRKVGDAGGS